MFFELLSLTVRLVDYGSLLLLIIPLSNRVLQLTQTQTNIRVMLITLIMLGLTFTKTKVCGWEYVRVKVEFGDSVVIRDRVCVRITVGVRVLVTPELASRLQTVGPVRRSSN